MLSINVRSFTPAVKDWLANSRHPRILYVFDQACNLINERRDVLSIVTPQIGNGPFNLVIEGDISFIEHLNAESPISILMEKLELGDVAINTVGAKPWNPRLDWETLHTKRNDILTQLPYFPISNSQFPNSLTTSLAKADTSSSVAAAQQLAGLGIGLTPAGDDFILGAALATRIIHPPEVAGPLVNEITDVAVPLTTFLSAAWLRSAGRGEAGKPWHELFEVFMFVSRTESPMGIANPTYGKLIQKTMANILSVGETSGADALAGFLAVFSAYKERMIDKCPS